MKCIGQRTHISRGVGVIVSWILASLLGLGAAQAGEAEAHGYIYAMSYLEGTNSNVLAVRIDPNKSYVDKDGGPVDVVNEKEPNEIFDRDGVCQDVRAAIVALTVDSTGVPADPYADEKKSLLTMAYLLKKPVRITAVNNNCGGNNGYPIITSIVFL